MSRVARAGRVGGRKLLRELRVYYLDRGKPSREPLGVDVRIVDLCYRYSDRYLHNAA